MRRATRTCSIEQTFLPDASDDTVGGGRIQYRADEKGGWPPFPRVR
jgi:hypothetical protein